MTDEEVENATRAICAVTVMFYGQLTRAEIKKIVGLACDWVDQNPEKRAGRSLQVIPKNSAGA